jgi:hypothetical protein
MNEAVWHLKLRKRLAVFFMVDGTEAPAAQQYFTIQHMERLYIADNKITE